MLHRGKAALRVLPQLHNCFATTHGAFAVSTRCFAAQAEPVEDALGSGWFLDNPLHVVACCFLLHTRENHDECTEDKVIERKGIKLRGVPFYLDMQATTPLDPRVLDAMLPYQTEFYGNPHSRTHLYGWESEDAVEVARKQVCVPASNRHLSPSLL